MIGARPGVGKSAFGMNLAIHAAHAGAQVCVCSREMTDTQYGQRLLAQASGVDGMRMRTGKISDGDWQAISDGMTLLDGPAANVSCSRCAPWKNCASRRGG